MLKTISTRYGMATAYLSARAILMVSSLIAVIFIFGAIEAFPPSLFVIGALAVTAIGRKTLRRLTSHGSASWASEAQIRRAGMLAADRGLIIGRLPTSPQHRLHRAVANLWNGRLTAKQAVCGVLSALARRRGELVSLPNSIHTAVFSPSGGGKGVSCVIPFLRTCEESCVVLDFKGENFELTAAHRNKHLGHQIIALAPFNPDSDTFNPLDFIDKDSPLALDRINELAKALVIRAADEKEPHWNDSAEFFIAAVTAVVVYYGVANEGTRSLQAVREILCNPEKLELAVKLMLQSDAWEGMLRRMGGQLMHYIEREKSSTLTTAGRHLRFLDSLPVAKNTSASSFNPACLLKGKTTIYLILPLSQMRVRAPQLRLWITSLLQAVVAGGLQEKQLVHFILDEAAALGFLESVSDALDKYRGYGVRCVFFYQSMGQLKTCWPNGQDQTFLSNTTQVFFGVNDQAIGSGGTADYVSARLGDATIAVQSGGTSTGTSLSTSGTPQQRSRSTSYSQNRNWQPQARRLLKPEEVVGLPATTAITFAPGLPPIRTTLLRYYQEPRLGCRPGWLGRTLKPVAALIASIVVGLWLMFGGFSLMVSAQALHANFLTRPATNQRHNQRADVPFVTHSLRERSYR